MKKYEVAVFLEKAEELRIRLGRYLKIADLKNLRKKDKHFPSLYYIYKNYSGIEKLNWEISKKMAKIPEKTSLPY